MFKYLAEDDIPEQLHKMKLKVKESLLKQTEVWHRTSKKKVAAGMYIQKYDDYIVAQNVGLSLVTGSICAERALIVSAVAKYPDLKMKDISWIFVLGESGCIAPCGVCLEWLRKVNENLTLYTEKDGQLVEFKVNDVLKEEDEIG